MSSDFVRATCRQCVCVCVCARARARLCTYISMCVHSVHVWSCCVRYTHTHETQPVKRRVLLTHTQKHTYTVCVEMHAACIHMHGHFAHPYVHTYTVYLHTHRRHITQVCACSVYYCCYYDIHPQRKRGHTPSHTRPHTQELYHTIMQCVYLYTHTGRYKEHTHTRGDTQNTDRLLILCTSLYSSTRVQNNK